MSEMLRQWAFSICAAMVAGAAMFVLVPNSKMKNIFRLVVSVFFLCCLISPFLLGNWELEDLTMDYEYTYQEKTEELDAAVKKQLREEVNRKVAPVVTELLERSEIFPEQVDIFVNTEDEDSIVISEIFIKLPEEYENRKNSIARLVEQEIGVAPKLIF